MTFAERIDYSSLMKPVAIRLLGEPNQSLSKPPRDVRFGNNGSTSVDYENGLWFDHEDQVGGGVLDLIANKTGRNIGEAQAWLRRQGIGPAGRAPSPSPCQRAPAVGTVGRFVEAYSYTDETGTLLFEVVRYDPKDFKQRRPGSTAGSWIWNLDGVRRVPYHLPDLIAAVRDQRTVVICEGEKDTNTVRSLGFVATTAVGGANKWQASYNEFFPDADVVLLPHNDRAGRDHARKIAASLQGIASRVRVLDLADTAWPECPEKGDVSDWIAVGGGTAERLQELIEATADWSPPPARLRPLDLKEFLRLSIKPREMLLDPILPEKGLAMLYAARGTGKTHVVLGVCFAIATATKFLKWTAPKPRRVLLIDGEMPAAALQERLSTIVANAPDVDLDPDNFKILAGDLIGGIGNLASSEVQEELDRWLDGIDVLALDNLWSLTAVIRDNDAESWGPIQKWLLKLRRRGISVVIVHHAGKGGQQRGTSRREDVLDTSISLRHPADYSLVEGARFEVHLEKARGVHGDAARPFEAKLEIRDGKAVWTTRELEDANRARVQALLQDGLSVRDIADETGIPKSTVHRIKKAIEAIGGDHGE